MTMATPLTLMKLQECTKIGYKDAEVAFKHLRYIQAISATTKVPTHFYECDRCNRYHLTSATKEQQRQRLCQLPLLSMAQNPMLHSHRMLQIAYAGTHEELAALVQHPSLTVGAELLLSINEDDEIRKLLAARHDLDIETQRVLVGDTESVKAVLLRNPTVAGELRPTPQAATKSTQKPVKEDTKKVERLLVSDNRKKRQSAWRVIHYLNKAVLRNEMNAAEHALIVYLVAAHWSTKRSKAVWNMEVLEDILGMTGAELATNLVLLEETGLVKIKSEKKPGAEFITITPTFLSEI